MLRGSNYFIVAAGIWFVIIPIIYETIRDDTMTSISKAVLFIGVVLIMAGLTIALYVP